MDLLDFDVSGEVTELGDLVFLDGLLTTEE